MLGNDWIAELILRGAWVAPVLRPFYTGFRASGLGTYDDDRGYLLDVRRSGTLGYNMKSGQKVESLNANGGAVAAVFHW